jgi:hypothetical protein
MSDCAENIPNEYDLPEWETPADYGGYSPVGDYVVAAIHRDSPLLDRCNWSVWNSELAKLDPEGWYWETFRAGHWAVGWVEYIIVKRDARDDVLRLCRELLDALADYPILDELLYNEREHEAICDLWTDMSIRERVDILSLNKLNIFAARHDEVPDDDCGIVYDVLSEYANV